MLNFIKSSLQESKRQDEAKAILSEMSEVDTPEELLISNPVDDAISPKEKKAIETIISNLPDEIADEGEKVTTKDIKAAKQSTEPTIAELAESFDLIGDEDYDV